MFDQKEFVESVIAKRLSLHEVIKEAREELLFIESRSIRPVGSSGYAQFLCSLVSFLISEVKVKPENLSDDNFQLLFRVAKYLADRGCIKLDVLELLRAGLKP